MTSIVQFRMDSEDKELLEIILKDMGLDMGSAFRMYARAILKKGVIPFEISSELDCDTIMTKENLKAYKKAKKDLQRGKTISHEELKRELGL